MKWGCSQAPAWNETGSRKRCGTKRRPNKSNERNGPCSKVLPINVVTQAYAAEAYKSAALNQNPSIHTFPTANSRPGLGGSRLGRVSQHPQWITSLNMVEGSACPPVWSESPLVWVFPRQCVLGGGVQQSNSDGKDTEVLEHLVQNSETGGALWSRAWEGRSRPIVRLITARNC